MSRKYTVIEAHKLRELVTEVNKYLDWGWELQGGVSSYRYKYIQAMTAPLMEETNHDPR